MANDQVAARRTQPEQDEPFFAAGMIRVVNQQSEVVKEYRLRFLERDAVLLTILGVLPFVPLEP